MSRFAFGLTALLAVSSLGGCADTDLSAYLDRNPALRTTQIGTAYDIGTVDHEPRAMRVDNRVAVLAQGPVWGCSDCARIEIHELLAVQEGLNQPWTLPFTTRIDLRDGLLLTDADLHEFDSDGQLTTNESLRELFPRLDDLDDVVVMHRDRVALATDETVFVFDRVGSTWEQTQRVSVTGSTLEASDTLLRRGKFVYADTPDGYELVMEDWYVTDLAGSEVLVAGGPNRGIWTWDGTELVLTVYDAKSASAERSPFRSVTCA